MADGKYIVRIPNLVRAIYLHDVFEFSRAVHATSTPMRITKHRMRTPVAFVRTTSRGNHVDAAHAMGRSPDIDIPGLIDFAPVRPRYCVQIGYFHAFRVRDHDTLFIAKYGARYAVQPVNPPRRQRRQQFRHGEFTFTHDDDIRSGHQVLHRIVGGFGPSQNYSPSVTFRCCDDIEHRLAGHEVRIDTNHSAIPRQSMQQLLTRLESGIKYLHVDAIAA